jgi:hypothetical protein
VVVKIKQNFEFLTVHCELIFKIKEKFKKIDKKLGIFIINYKVNLDMLLESRY